MLPNPANTFFTFIRNDKNIKEVTLLNAEGKLIKNYQKPFPAQFSIAEFANGLYQVKIVDADGHTTVTKLNIIRH
nr:T9SS type A sorting domain-containing protein [Bacteroidota bacterium]